MKKQLFVLVAGLMVLSILAAPVQARTTRDPFEGTFYFGDYLSAGRQWVSEDGILHVRGMESIFSVESDDARINGEVLQVFNSNWALVDPPLLFHGPMWGTLRIENASGYWEGSWTGERTEEGATFVQCVLRGGDDYEGLQARLYLSRVDDLNPEAPLDLEGVIMNPGGD